MRIHHTTREARGGRTIRTPTTAVAVQRMHNSPPRQANSSRLDVSRSSALPVNGLRFTATAVRDELWTRPTSVLAVRGRVLVDVMAAIVAGKDLFIHVQKIRSRT